MYRYSYKDPATGVRKTTSVENEPVKIYFPSVATFRGDLPPVSDPRTCRQLLSPMVQYLQMGMYCDPLGRKGDCQYTDKRVINADGTTDRLKLDTSRPYKVITRDHMNAMLEWCLWRNKPTYFDFSMLYQLVTLNDWSRLCDRFPITAQRCIELCKICLENISVLDVHECYTSLLIMIFAWMVRHIVLTRVEVSYFAKVVSK